VKMTDRRARRTPRLLVAQPLAARERPHRTGDTPGQVLNYSYASPSLVWMLAAFCSSLPLNSLNSRSKTSSDSRVIARSATIYTGTGAGGSSLPSASSEPDSCVGFSPWSTACAIAHGCASAFRLFLINPPFIIIGKSPESRGNCMFRSSENVQITLDAMGHPKPF